MSLTVSSFFQYYMFHSNKADTEEHRIISMITSIALGILTLGLVHIICFAAFYDRKIGQVSAKSATDSKSEEVFKKVIEEDAKEKASPPITGKDSTMPAAVEDFDNSQSDESQGEISQGVEKASAAASVEGSETEPTAHPSEVPGQAASAAKPGTDLAGKALKTKANTKEKRKSLETDPPPSKSHSSLHPRKKKLSGGTASSEEKELGEKDKAQASGGVDTMTASAKKIGSFLVSGTLTVNGSEDSSTEGKKDRLTRSRSVTFPRKKSDAHEDSSLTPAKKISPSRWLSVANLKKDHAEEKIASPTSASKGGASGKSTTEEKRKSARKWFSIKNLKMHHAEEEKASSASEAKDDASDKSTEEKRKHTRRWFSVKNLMK